uniref:TP53-binding protein 1 n=1 Tax=Mola mola TaxID=94237 RepID=A0A3Q3XFZ0_MOLML
MEPRGSQLDSSLPQPENPCLIVEDSQPDSVALEDDPESSYRALLARRLSSLQPAARPACSPVLVGITLISHRFSHLRFASISGRAERQLQNYRQSGQHHSEVRLRVVFNLNSLVVLMSVCCEQCSPLSPSRSEVSSSSSSEPPGRSGQQLSVQVLLHSQGLQVSQQDCEILSSQEDLFGTDKTGAAVDSTVSEPEQPGHPTPTPARSLRLLHLSGQGTLVQETLSTTLPPPKTTHLLDRRMNTVSAEEDEPMDTEAISKPHPSASTPVSQNSPHFVLEQTLAVPSQPDFSHVRRSGDMSANVDNTEKSNHNDNNPSSRYSTFFSFPLQDVFVPTQSQDAAQQLEKDTASQCLDSAAFTLPLQLSADAASGTAQQDSQLVEDSQATQIEELEEPPGVDTCDSMTSRCDQNIESNGVPLESQGATSPKASTSVQSQHHRSESAKDAQLSPSQKSDVHKTSLNVQNTPSDTTSSSLASQSMISQAEDVKKSSAESQSAQSPSQNHAPVADSHAARDVMDECQQGGAEEEESTVGGGASGMALVLSQSKLLSPEPMEDSVIVVTDSERDTQILQKDVAPQSKTNSSQPIRGTESLSTNGHESQALAKKVLVDSDRLSQTEGAGPEPEGLKDKSLSDSSGEISFHFTLPKEGELIGPVVGVTPPLINQLKQTLRHSTPIELKSFSEKSDLAGDVSADAAMAASAITSGDSGEDTAGKGDGKLSLRMKLVTPVEEVSSERFSLQSKSLFMHQDGIHGDAAPSVFSRVRQVHRQQEEEEEVATPIRYTHPQSLVTVVLITLSCVSQLRQRSVSLQTSFDAPGLRSPAGRGERASPSSKRATGPSHRRHVRTVQEVRTTITRIITDVYYEDGKEVERKVSEESEEPVVDCQVLDSDVSPCRTGSSSVTSGDLGDISSLSSKASSLQHSSGGTSGNAGLARPDFIVPSSRGAKPIRGGVSSLQRLGAHGHPQSSSEDEPYTRMLPPRLPVSAADTESSSHSDSLRSLEDEEEEEAASSGGSSFVGLRVVAKWSSNGYFYSGRIMKDAGEGRFRLRFDDGYECEVAGKDILLCDPIPLETEVTALLENEYFSIGVVRGHKTEGQQLFYSVEKDGQRQWYNRTAVILSLEQGNKLREQHSLGPYQPSTPLTKASDISLDNLVEGKRRRRGAPENTPNRSSSSSPRTPQHRGPTERGGLMFDFCTERECDVRRGSNARFVSSAQRVGVCNTSGSGTDLPGRSCDVAQTHGPLPHNASLFMGFAFMLTYVQTGPYNKEYTESQLRAGGGFILPDFNEEQCKAAYQSLLIADQHCRTRKYLLCLASGVPCVSHLWVRDCCKDNKLLNYRNYLLPAGVGPDEAIVEWHPRCSPFKALRVLLVFERPVELWAQLITMGGGSSARQFQAEKDSSGTDSPAKTVTSQEVPLVSAEWLIQSVIRGERLGFHSQPQYRHDYSS